MYCYKTKIRLHQTDAAGILFFSHQLTIMHDAYEDVLEKIGFGFADILRKSDFFLPIVHIQADYKAPLFVGDGLDVHVDLGDIGTTSFTFTYKIFKRDKTLVGTGKTVHVTIDKERRKKIPLPQRLVSALKKFF